ncbi:MAG: hypothetical protein EZS28_007634, partial [Streblomastix strix]
SQVKELNPSYGKVPAYIIERRKLKQAVEELKKLEAERNARPGLMLLSEQERLDTLDTLTKKHDLINTELNHLPIAMKTVASEK